MTSILVTGGAGFIGSAFVRLVVRKGYQPVVVDKLTYAGDLKRLDEVKDKFKFYRSSICDRNKIEGVIRKEKIKLIVNFAAETHVDRSIDDSSPFLQTNVMGVQVLLESARKYNIEKFIHISTDEVYGEIAKGEFSEGDPLYPNSPYAASKAAADLLIRSFIKTHGFPAIIIRPSNNYGPWQYPEKFIPRAILNLLIGKKIPLYGKGANIREWLYVDDCAQGILRILEKGKVGEVYNLGSTEEKRNIETAKLLLKIFNKSKDMIQFVKDRPGHDLRYRLNSEKVFKQTDWRSKTGILEGLKKTAEWYVHHKAWAMSDHNDIAKFYKRRIKDS